MAFLEITRDGSLVKRRHIDDRAAEKGICFHLGSEKDIRMSLGQTKTVGPYTIRLVSEGVDSPRHDEVTASSAHMTFSKDRPHAQESILDIPPDVPGYRILECLGRGGMGSVWRAEQLSVKREVALKFMAQSHDHSTEAQIRFRREVELTGSLDHPNIAKLYDSGLCEGRYYYAMELIQGDPLDQYVRNRRLSGELILRLMLQICQAVQCAHQKGVIHRDLKPSNVLVDQEGQPHILDFGLAKTFWGEKRDKTVSIQGAVLGTPAYMAPEQAAGTHEQMDTRSDVFSLGVILYALLLGQTPHDLSGTTLDLLQRIGQGQIRKPREVNTSVPLDLEAVILKALSLDMDHRYLSAGDMADDLRTYLKGEPVRAQVPTRFYVLRKKARKYRARIAISLVLFICVSAVARFAYVKMTGEQARRRYAEARTKFQEGELDLATLSLIAMGEDKREAQIALNLIQEAYTAAKDEASRLNFKLADRAPSVAVRRIHLGQGEPLASSALVRKPGIPGGVVSWTLETYTHRARITKLVYSPDGNRLASAGRDGTIRVWESDSGKLVHLLVDPNTQVVDLAWSLDGKSLLGTTGNDPLAQVVWVLEADGVRAGDRRPTEIGWQDPYDACWSADPQMPGQPAEDAMGLLGIQRLSTWPLLGKPLTALALSPGRKRLACGDEEGTIRTLDVESGQVLHTRFTAGRGPIESVDLSPDGEFLATYTSRGTLCLWESDRWEPVRKLKTGGIRHGTDLTGGISWAPDSGQIARVGGRGMSVEVVDLHSGDVARALPGAGELITCVAWARQDSLIAAGAWDGSVYLWDLRSDSAVPTVIAAHNGPLASIEWTPHGQTFITAGRDGMIRLWQAVNGDVTMSLERRASPVVCTALSRDGRAFATCSSGGVIRVWNAETGWASRRLKIDPNSTEGSYDLTAVTWSPDGVWLACGDSVGRVHIFDSGSRQWQRSIQSNSKPVSSLAWSANGRVLLCGGGDGMVRGWDTTSDFAQHVVLLPLRNGSRPGIAVGSTGDYRGWPGVADDIVYAVRTEEACLTLSQADFKRRYGWVNESWQVGLYSPGQEKVERIYVDSRSERPRDGKTWATAFSDLQDALSAAQPNTEIWVAAGLYRPDRGTQARTASFHLKNGVRLLGGFSGIETSSDQRDPDGNETILSGDLKGDDRPDFVNIDENSYHVVVANDVDPNTLLDGFTITGGNANGPLRGERSSGGGMYALNGSPTIMNCIFKQNTAMRLGGGIAIRACRQLKLDHCDFVDNLAGDGGGVGIEGSSPSLVGCRFIANKAVGKIVAERNEVYPNGGGVSVHYSQPTLSHCLFSLNTAIHGGGMYLYNESRATVTNCRFTENSGNDGGGTNNDGASEVMYIDCTFIMNTANGGGGMYNNRCSAVTVTNCRFIGNDAISGGGMTNGSDSMAVLYNCSLSGNRAKNGGAIFNEERWEHRDPNILMFRESQFVNCTISMNHAEEFGGGIWNNTECNPEVINCILWGNSDHTGRHESTQIYRIQGEQSFHIEHSCVQGWTGQLGGTGCFGDDPQFVDLDGPDNQIGTEDDNLSLRSGSPCINAGDNSALPADTFDLDEDGDPNEPIPYDLNRNPRILSDMVDVGALEAD